MATGKKSPKKSAMKSATVSRQAGDSKLDFSIANGVNITRPVGKFAGKTSLRKQKSNLSTHSDDDDYDNIDEEEEDSNNNNNSNNNTNTPISPTKTVVTNQNNTLTNPNGKIINNSNGKQGKLINNEESTEDVEKNDQEYTSDMEVDVDNGSSDSSSDEDEENDNDNSGFSSDSSEDENVDFVRLTAQRKKKALKALNAMKRGNLPSQYIPKSNSHATNSQMSSDNDNDDEALSPKTIKAMGTTEDIGEEISLDDNAITKNDNNSQSDDANDDSDYQIDDEEYFNTIKDDDNKSVDGESDTGVETGENDSQILEEEEENIMNELQNDDSLSFDGSIHETGSDPEDWDSSLSVQSSAKYNEDDFLQLNIYEDYAEENINDNESDNDSNDEIMMELTMPFYEDSKFANLYYYEDGTEPRLGLSTQLPILLNEDERQKIRRKVARRREKEERKIRRRKLRESQKDNTTKNLDDDGNDYIFSAFFHSDADDTNDMTDTKLNSTSQTPLDVDSSVRQLESSMKKSELPDYESSNEGDILMDEADLASDDLDSIHSKEHSSSVVSPNDSLTLTLADIDAEISSDEISDLNSDEDSDEVGLSNVFVDLDDLDPDSFYFNMSDDNSSIFSDNSSVPKIGNKDIETQDAITVFVDDETTDEDDNLPPPEVRSKSIGTKAKEIVKANVIGLKPPKLGTWKTDSKPFSIIDGLSTKSLVITHPKPVNEEKHVNIREDNNNTVRKQSNVSMHSQYGETSTNADGDELTLNELLNMSELEEDTNDPNSNSLSASSDWFKKHKVPLSAFRNKGVSSVDDEFMLPANTNRKVPFGYIGSERTRKKIDRMKELQRKESEKRKKLKKRKKLIKLKRARDRLEKEKRNSVTEAPSVLSTEQMLIYDQQNSFNISDMNNDEDMIAKQLKLPSHDTSTYSNRERLKSVGMDELNDILGKDNNSFLTEQDKEFNDANMEKEDLMMLQTTDADILASLTAPVSLDEFNSNSGSLWRRRQSMVEAAEENMRFTKNGVFSENALADIESIINNHQPSTILDINEATS